MEAEAARLTIEEEEEEGVVGAAIPAFVEARRVVAPAGIVFKLFLADTEPPSTVPFALDRVAPTPPVVLEEEEEEEEEDKGVEALRSVTTTVVKPLRLGGREVSVRTTIEGISEAEEVESVRVGVDASLLLELFELLLSSSSLSLPPIPDTFSDKLLLVPVAIIAFITLLHI